MRSGRKSASQTPAPLKDRIYGSKKNKEGSASSDKSAKSIILSAETLIGLKNKLKEFKEKHPNNDNITLNDLKAVYRRGLGAYSSTHRPTITGGVPNTRNAWAMARVNKFLLKASGEKVKKAYVQDDDLMKNGGNLKNNNMFETIGRLIRPNTLEQIAKEHNVNMGFLQKQFEIGTKEEMEHTFDTETAETIALHHLSEDPQYYIKLKEMMLRTEAEKLDDYYANGGQVLSQAKCEVLDKNGERQIDPISIAKLTECVNNLPQTKFMHYDLENDKYKDYRTRLHKEIIYDIKKNVVCVESKNEPIAILMGGSPASGKSTFLKKYAEYLLQDEILKIDADEVRSKLPEYKGYNASQTHLETKDIVTTLLSNRNIGIPCLFDVIYDGTMNNTKSYLPLISLLKSLGYKVFMVYIDNVPKEVAIERSLQRYKKSGRFVPIEVIEDFFDKGKSAMEQIKKEVDGYMIVDGGNSNYDIIEQGGMKLPQNREYSKIGSPIEITEDEVVREFKKGGEVDPDNTEIKEMVTHKSGEVGGLLVGNRHSEGGIKAVNKSTGQPLEMEGGEVVITRNAVSDTKKRMFEGEMLTNREILSRINEEGGGVSFEEGGKVEDDDCGCNHKMKKGGDLLEDTLKAPKKITDKINEMFADKFQFEFENGGQVYSKEELIRIVNKQVPSFVAYKNHKKPDPIKDKLEYKNYLYNVYDVRFEELPQMIQMALLVGSQTIVDNYLNKK
jgi:predicted ABC-type ATPase